MKRFALLTLSAASVLALGVAAVAKPITFELPPETAEYKPGPNLDVVKGNCGACHSADYIRTQPQGPKFKKDFWQAEVVKMIKVYGAPIEEADIPKIVEYLSTAY
jgi:mono/diheme cytochrome c family protein